MALPAVAQRKGNTGKTGSVLNLVDTLPQGMELLILVDLSILNLFSGFIVSSVNNIRSI